MVDLLATVDDFEDRHGTLEAADASKVDALLRDATALILEAVEGSGADWVDGETDPPRSVQSVCVSVAYRAWSNPDALSQTSMGDVSISYTRGGTPDAVFLTKAEERIVSKAAKSSTFRAVTLVSPYSGPDTSELL